jgi:hypothetical protein
MTSRNERPINGPRVLAMSVVLFLLALGICAFVNRLPDTTLGNAAALVAGIYLTPLLASPYEWLVHRYIYHRHAVPGLERIYTIHHHSHHYVFFPTWRYVTSGPARRIPITGDGTTAVATSHVENAVTRLAHFAFYLVLGLVLIIAPAWLVTHHLIFLLGSVASLLVISNLFVTVHDTIHRPGSHCLIEAQPWFHFLDNHHYIHHVDTEANVNFLLPLADWLFGTLRRTLTEAELRAHGSLAEAKATPVGSGEPAREAVRAMSRGVRDGDAGAPDGFTAAPMPDRARVQSTGLRR